MVSLVIGVNLVLMVICVVIISISLVEGKVKVWLSVVIVFGMLLSYQAALWGTSRRALGVV